MRWCSLQLDQSTQHFDRECAVRFHVEDTWPIDLSALAPPRTFTQRTARVDRVRVTNHQDLLLVLFLKGFNYEMLTEVRHIDTLDRINTGQPACSLDQQIDNRAAAIYIAGR